MSIFKKVLRLLVMFSLVFFITFDFINSEPMRPEEYKNILQLNNKVDLFLDPLCLLDPYRIDLMAKYIYAKHRKIGVTSSWSYKLYTRHLQVWNHFYEKKPYKNNLNDFIQSFHKILQNIKESGFLGSKSKVIVDRKKRLSDGSHRTAACLLYQVPIWAHAYFDPGDALQIDANFFKKRQLEEHFIDSMVLEYCKMQKNTYVGLLFPIRKGKNNEALNIFRSFGKIVYRKDISLTQRGVINLIKHAYAGEKWLGDLKNNFKGARGAANARFPKGRGTVQIIFFECDSLDKVKLCKKKIRDLYRIGNFAVHINDTHSQTVILAKSLLNANSIHFMNHSEQKNYETFENYFNEYQRWIDISGVDQDCFCVDSSAVLSAYGIRDCRDIDFLHHGYTEFSKASPFRFIDSHNDWVQHYTASLDDIVFNPANHFYYMGFKFASLGMVKKMKMKRNENKDRVDVSLIEKFLIDSKNKQR